MPRGDGVQDEYRFADGDDDAEDLGYGGGGSRKYDDDDEDEGGWATHRETDDLWDSTEDLDEDEEAPVEGSDAIAEVEDEEDAFGRVPATRATGAPKSSAGASTAAKPAAKTAAKAASKPKPAAKKPAKKAGKAAPKAAQRKGAKKNDKKKGGGKKGKKKKKK